MRVIAHVDLDAFYASVEIRDDPSLAGRPVVVGGEGRRSVVAAASYAARKFGVHSAMPMARARALCKELVIVPPRMHHYARESESFFAILGRWSPLVEGLSLDEAFLDLTGTEALFGDPEGAIADLRRAVRSELGLACSAGIAPVKFVAKIASDVAKPDGQLRVRDGEVQRFLDPLPVSRLWGVGDKTQAQLERLAIRTIADLRRADPGLLTQQLGGHHGAHLVALANGRDERAVIGEREAKSMGSEETFDRDLVREDDIAVHLLAQAEKVAERLRHAGLVARGVTLKYKLADFTLVTRQTTLAAPSDDGQVLYQAIRALFRASPPRGPIRLCGVSAHGLEPPPLPGLFAAPGASPEATERRARLNQALDSIHQKHGGASLVRARLLELGARPNAEDPPKPGSTSPPRPTAKR